MSRLAFSAVFAAALTGCTGEASKDQAPPGDSGTTVTDDTGDGGTGEDLLQPGEGAFGGRIVDDDNAPLEGILVNLCKESCYAQRTDADGRWQHVVPADIYSFEALEGDPMAPTRGWPLAPVKVEDGSVRTLDTDVKMPLLTHQQELRTEEWVAIADGLDLFCDPNSWTPPDLAAEDAEPWVGGVRVDVASSGLPWDLLPGEPVALWYLHPLDTRPSADWSVRLRGDVGLVPGDAATLYVADYGDRSWVAFSTVTVDDEGAIRATNVPIPVMGPVVLVR